MGTLEVPPESTPRIARTSVSSISSIPVGRDPSEVSLVNERLTLEAFYQLAGKLAGIPYVKVVWDRERDEMHFIDNEVYPFHAEYIAETFLGKTRKQIHAEIDAFNRSVYSDPARRFYLGILALQKKEERRFFTLETVEIDTMDGAMMTAFFTKVRDFTDPQLPLYFKPANHGQEEAVQSIDAGLLPRVFNHELTASADFVALNPGVATGRLRAFRSDWEYRQALATIEWFDILVMHRVPDDLPRVSGVINAHHTTPLSHTNVLAAGWGVPNAVQLRVFEQIQEQGLDGQWVRYAVDMNAQSIELEKIERPAEVPQRPSWSVNQVKIEAPETVNTPIVELGALRMSDRFRYGTKAANLGELLNVLKGGSRRLLGFYRIPRPPRENLLPYLARWFGVAEGTDLNKPALDFLRANVQVPRGIAIPFSVQQEFLESSPRIQQAIGKLKMAIELNAREIDAICLKVQQLVRTTRMPESIRDRIDSQIAESLSGVSSFVVRSSSNAEDLENFSAAGIYESLNHVTSADKIFEGIKEVWASLLSARSVRLRQQVGISLDDVYMGVIVQEEIRTAFGGVLVTTNPMNRAGDFRNVYANVSEKSVVEVVQGEDLPIQYLFNTLEGGGRTLSLGGAKQDLPDSKKARIQRLAVAGRLLQSHFSPDYTFSAPLDIEWAADLDRTYVLQIRPYAK